MIKTLQLKSWLLLLLMLVGVGNAWADDAYYTLDTTNSGNATTNNAYASSGTVTVEGIGWSFGGNGQTQPWRLGGKSLSKTNREAYTTTAMGAAIRQVDLTVGTASSITVNSLKLIVASDASFNTVIDQVSESFSASSTISFTPTSGDSWAAGAYYKFVFNVTVSGSTNRFVQFSKVEFYEAVADVAVTGVSLNKTETSIVVGSTETLTATVEPDNATNKNVTWTSSNEEVATVDGGVVTAVAAGSATITVTTEDGEYTDECEVTVTNPVIDNRVAVNMTGFTATSTTLVKGGTTETSVTNDQNGWAAAYTYESNNTEVATVDEDGVITAVAKGEATITASLNLDENDEDYKAGATTSMTVDITVNNPSHTVTFSVNGETSTDTKEEGATIEFPANPAAVLGKQFMGWVAEAIDGTTDEEPEWVTSATMGESDVTYYAVFATVSGEENSGSLTITPESENIPTSYGTAKTFTEYTLEGKKFKIQQMYLNNGKLQWRASGNSNGTGTMYNTEDLGKIQSVVLTYNSSDTNKNFTLKVGNAENPTSGTEISPSVSGSVYTFDCSAENAGYFVLTNGTSAGYLDQIEINYKTGSASYSGYCTSVLPISVESVSLDKTELTLAIGDSETLTATVSPDNAANKNVTWASSDEDVATVEDGVVAAVAAGEATITVTTEDGSKTATCVVTVTAPVAVTGVTLDNTELSLYAGGTATLTPTIAPADATNKNVTWASSDEDVATVEDGVVTAVAVGTATITVTTVDGEKTATCEVTVTAAPGSEARPYTVAEAIAAIDAGTGVEGVYATGIVSEIVTAYSSQYGNISYNISADGSTDSDQLQAFRGKSYNGDKFTSEDDIQVGDVVVIKGNLTKYGSTYEFSTDNQLVSLVRKAATGLSYETTSYSANLGEDFATPELTNPNDLTVTYSSSDTEVATVDAETGAVTLVAAGETTITAAFAGNASYREGSASYTLTVIDPSEPVDICTLNSITPTELTVGDMGDFILSADFVDGVVEDEDYEISWSSSDSDILDVAGTTYEAKAAGKVTVTVRVEVLDEETYNNVEKAFEVTVKAPKTYVALVAEYDGKFYALNSTFSSNTFSATVVNIVNHKVINGQTDAVSWLVTETDGMATILNKDESTYVGFSGKNLTTSESDWTVDNTNSTWNTGANRTILYRESANGFKNYATSNVNSSDYSGYTTAYTFADGYTREVTGGNFGTICLPYDVAADDFSGVKFYQIAAKTMNGDKLKSVTLEEVTELVGGAAYLFQADEEATKLVAAYSGSEAGEEIPADVSGTGLTGTYTKQYIPESMYMLKNGKLYYVDAENYVYSGANKAYIDLTDIPEAGANVKGIVLFSGDLETAIQSVGDETTERIVYNLSGQRVQKPVRGVYVVNGQKIVVK